MFIPSYQLSSLFCSFTSLTPPLTPLKVNKTEKKSQVVMVTRDGSKALSADINFKEATPDLKTSPHRWFNLSQELSSALRSARKSSHRVCLT